MVQLSPRVACEADAGDIWMDFSMEPAFYGEIGLQKNVVTSQDTQEELEMSYIEVEVETDASEDVFTLVLPQETIMMVPQREEDQDIIEVQSTIQLPVTSDLEAKSLSDPLMSTVNTCGLDLTQTFYMGSSGDVLTPTETLISCNPADVLGTLPLEQPAGIHDTLPCSRGTSRSPSMTSSATDTADDSTRTSFLDDALDGALDDVDLARATMTAMKTGKMTSLIKEELRCLIQSQRLSEGKDELDAKQLNEVQTEEELSATDEERRRQRRARNRIAAQKCRQRKRERTEELEGEVELLRQKKTCYDKEIKKLEAEKKKLMQMLENHDNFPGLCTRRLSGSES